MTIRWERFEGTTDTFAMRIAFMQDPDAGAAADPEEAASWGAFQLWVDGQNLCAHVDQGEALQSSHWYLLPLLEWLVENWNAFLHEEKLPNRNNAETAVAALAATRNAPALAGEAETVAWEEEWYEWWGRHALRSARDGGLLPNVVVRRQRDLIEVSWDDEPVAGTPVGFRHNIANGVALLYPEQVARPLYEIVVAAVGYLRGIHPTGGRVAALQSRINQLTLPSEHDRRLKWLAGLRQLPVLPGLHGSIPDYEMNSRWHEIVTALKSTGNDEAAAAALSVEESELVVNGSCHAALLFSSLSPTVTGEDVRRLALVLTAQYTRTEVAPRLDSLTEETPLDPTIPAWEQGYELAEKVHAEVHTDLSRGWVDVAGVLTHLGVDVLTRKLADPNIRACGIVGPHHRPTVILNDFSTFFDSLNAQRFSLAHELCHFIFDRSRGKRLAIASGPWAPRGIERRANAFAAMFLMPTELVQLAVADAPDPINDLAGISAIARTLRVSRRAAIGHLYNLTLMSEFDRDELLRQVPERY